MEIRIHVPRPLLTFTAIAVFLLWWTGIVAMNFGVKKAQVDGSGGGAASTLVANATQDFDRERVKQSVLERREEILRYELQILEQEALKEKNPGKLKDLEETRSVLLSIIRQRAESEKLLKLSLEQLWDAEGTVYSDLAPSPGVSFLWPAEPAWGLSATFLDSAYRERFGVPHYAIDIPIAQESAVKAARDFARANRPKATSISAETSRARCRSQAAGLRSAAASAFRRCSSACTGRGSTGVHTPGLHSASC